ncbi:uncharacterized protein LOC135843737 [Planococcus citri]|uniref:uncharacterized protein LOC135843737 n=1 Tax=Planococcus citri TaxID=170843 RepID=UPI0031F9BA84
MARQSFSINFLLFFFCLCAFLDTAMLANPYPDSPTVYYVETTEADFGVRMSYDPVKDKALNVIIAYDTLTTSASTFFTTQITAKLIDDFTKCNVIAWNFSPCTTTKISTGATLSCPKGVDQCRYDQVHGCLDDAFNWHQDTMGKFVVCTYTAGKSCEDCNNQEGGLFPEDMKACITRGSGAGSCNASYNDFQNAKKKPKTQTEIDNSANLPNAITDFKKSTCAMLAKINLKCDAVCST